MRHPHLSAPYSSALYPSAAYILPLSTGVTGASRTATMRTASSTATSASAAASFCSSLPCACAGADAKHGHEAEPSSHPVAVDHIAHRRRQYQMWLYRPHLYQEQRVSSAPLHKAFQQ